MPRPLPCLRLRLLPLVVPEAPPCLLNRPRFRRQSLAVVLLASVALPGRAGADFQVAPPAVALDGNFARAQLVVTERGADAAVHERSSDLTHQARYVSSDPRIVTVSDAGVLLARADGSATVSVRVGDVGHPVAVTVKGVVARPVLGFQEHVMPVLAKAGCNAGACHASQYGKGGFKLSVFGFAPEDDYRAIVRDSMGRRASILAPASSLLLRKPTGAVPHEGGQRLETGSVEYRIVEQWLARGAPPPSAKAPKVAALRVWTVAPRRPGRLHAATASPGDLRQRVHARRDRPGSLRQHG